jgi:uncharacterized integral membrane protein
MVCFQLSSFCIHSEQEVFHAQFRIRSCLNVISLWFVYCDWQTISISLVVTIFNILCHIIFQIGNTTLFNLIWKERLCFYKRMLSFKPVQMRPNHGMDLIHDNYAKPQPIDSLDWFVVSSIIFMS